MVTGILLLNTQLCNLESDLSASNSKSRCQDNTRWPPEYWKMVVAFAYINFAGFVSACVLVIAHERLPNTNSYPPLPDLLLDNLPHVSWAFEAAEFIALILFALFVVVVALHRHKAIILRRLCTLFGTVFLLRSVTLIITSLSVPGRHLQVSTERHPLSFSFAAVCLFSGHRTRKRCLDLALKRDENFARFKQMEIQFRMKKSMTTFINGVHLIL